MPTENRETLMKTTATNRRLGDLLSDLREEKLIPDPEFQRRLVWTAKHKINFIDTVLKNLPFPEIYLAAGEVDVKTGKRTTLLVDGQQRMTTLLAYFDGSPEFRSKQLKPYCELSRDEQTDFLEYDVVVRDLGKIEVDTIKEIFKRINMTQYALNSTERLNATFGGKFKRFCEGMSQHSFFAKHAVFTEGDKRRMYDMSFTITLVITIMSSYFRRDEMHESYLETYDAEFPEEKVVESELEQTFDFVDSCQIDPHSRAWKQVDLLTLLVEVHAALFKDALTLDPKAVGRAATEFYQSVDEIDTSSNKKKIIDGQENHKFDVRGVRYLRAATRAATDKYRFIRNYRAQIRLRRKLLCIN
jgi:uncharacterized protein with ParB-like and HNH nuclease domain